MTIRIKLLSAAALLTLPAVAGAQATQPAPQQPGTTMGDVSQTVQQAQDGRSPSGEQIADETPRQTEQPAAQPAQQPGAEQDSPPAPSATRTTPADSTQSEGPASGQAEAGATTAATAADVTAGGQVRDTAGAEVGRVESVDADSAIVSTGTVRADIPISSFGRNGQGLVLAMTRAQLEAAARAATPRTPGS